MLLTVNFEIDMMFVITQITVVTYVSLSSLIFCWFVCWFVCLSFFLFICRPTNWKFSMTLWLISSCVSSVQPESNQLERKRKWWCVCMVSANRPYPIRGQRREYYSIQSNYRWWVSFITVERIVQSRPHPSIANECQKLISAFCHSSAADDGDDDDSSPNAHICLTAQNNRNSSTKKCTIHEICIWITILKVKKKKKDKATATKSCRKLVLNIAVIAAFSVSTHRNRSLIKFPTRWTFAGRAMRMNKQTNVTATAIKMTKID